MSKIQYCPARLKLSKSVQELYIKKTFKILWEKRIQVEISHINLSTNGDQ